MRAYARKHKPADRIIKKSKRQLLKSLTVPPPPAPPPSANTHFEAAWTDSWSHRRCLHEHKTLWEAIKCAMPRGCGWYVFAVEDGKPRELRDAEDEVVNCYRFGSHGVDM
jgi:hypothetical protein